MANNPYFGYNVPERLTFEWDDAKDLENRFKHGVPFVLARHAFSDPRRVIAEDAAHSSDEARLYCIGSVGGNIMTVRFTVRGDSIRIFGAGYWRNGKALYEKTNTLH